MSRLKPIFSVRFVLTFRYQNDSFELIGYDQSEFSRASGEESSESINFSTGKKSTTTGGNIFEDNESNPKTTWSTITKKNLLRLEDCNEETAFSFQQ